MRILIYADSQTIFVQDWIKLICNSSNHTVLLVCSTTGNIFNASSASDFKRLTTEQTGNSLLLSMVKSVRRLFIVNLKLDWFETLLNIYRVSTVSKYSGRLQAHINDFQPDLIHAMRIPFEGIIASNCVSDKPLVLSIWGNDLTLHGSNPGKKSDLIRLAIVKCSAIHADAQRDIDTIQEQDRYKSEKLKKFLLSPASGGVDANHLRLDISKSKAKEMLGFDNNSILITNARGVRPYINSDLFADVAEILTEYQPESVFIMVAGGKYRSTWSFSRDAQNTGGTLISTDQLDIECFRLLLRATDILISPSRHDGLPISLIEGMGSGAFPIISNLESVSHMIRDKTQGRLFEVDNKEELLSQLTDVITHVNLQQAAKLNEELIQAHFSSENCRNKIISFYEEI